MHAATWSLAAMVAGLPQAPAPLVGEEAERFLASAEFVDEERSPVGVTGPMVVTLELDGRRARGLFKTIDQHKQIARFSDGSAELDFRDSFGAEVAAYELDKLLGLGVVPPTVQRRWGAESGSLQLWLEDTMTEKERMERAVEPPDLEAWNRQMHTVRLFHQLIYDTDRTNARNLLIDSDFRIMVIDSSRAFRIHEELLAPDSLTRFSRRVIESLRALEKETARSRLERWLSRAQIDALLARRDLILKRVAQLVSEQGEPVVLFP